LQSNLYVDIITPKPEGVEKPDDSVRSKY
jgi:hypothetical protein